MKKRFGDNDIIRFLYNEMAPHENEVFLDALTKDEELWDRYEYFQEVGDQLEEVEFEPSAASVANVMAFVKADDTKPEPAKKPWLKAQLIPSSVTMGVVMACLMFAFFVNKGTLGNSPAETLEATTSMKEGPTLVHEVIMDERYEDTPAFNWEDEGIENQLQSIKQKTQTISQDPLL